MEAVVIGKGKAIHAIGGFTENGVPMTTGATACGRAIGAADVRGELGAITCKACGKRTAPETAETLFTLETARETETAPETVETETVEREYHPSLAYVSATRSQTETAPETTEAEAPETETETDPSDAEIFRMMASDEIAETVLTGYTAAEWIDVMLSTDTHAVDMSRGLAVERLFMTKQAARRAKREAAATARVERAARIAAATERAETARNGAAYAAMTSLMSELRTRGVVMTLSADAETVRVESLTWIKGDGDTLETVATFTVRKDGKVSVKRTGSRAHTVTIAGAVELFTEILPERSRDLMPRKFRDVMRTHRHKNSTPVDVTGNRAARAVDGVETATLTAADLTAYAATLENRAAAIGVRTSGKRSMQGVKLTETERRESDRARQAAYRAAKRARAIAESMASFTETA